jgi:hypothetical protein
VSYDLYAPHYIQHGFRPVPIAPGSKAPHFWTGREFKLLTGWGTREPLRTPQPGAGLGILTGHNVVGYDIDTDEPAIFAALKKVVPDSPVGKRGQRGETLFYYDPPGRPSRKFKIGGKVRIGQPLDDKKVCCSSSFRGRLLPPGIRLESAPRGGWCIRA